VLCEHVYRWSAIDSNCFKPVLVSEQNVASQSWSLLNVCRSPRQKDSQETLRSSTYFGQPDVLGQASSSLAQLFSPSALHIHLGCNNWRRFGVFYCCSDIASCCDSDLLTKSVSNITVHYKLCFWSFIMG